MLHLLSSIAYGVVVVVDCSLTGALVGVLRQRHTEFQQYSLSSLAGNVLSLTLTVSWQDEPCVGLASTVCGSCEYVLNLYQSLD